MDVPATVLRHKASETCPPVNVTHRGKRLHNFHGR